MIKTERSLSNLYLEEYLDLHQLEKDKLSDMTTRKPNHQVREIFYEIEINCKKGINKLKKVFFMSLMSDFLQAENTIKRGDTAIPKIEMSLDDLYSCYPRRIRKLFASLDLNHKGLETVKMAVKRNDWPTACENLVYYYLKGDTCGWLRRPTIHSSPATDSDMELILQDIFTFQDVTGKVPHFQNNLLDWTHKGPKNDKEWAWFLNRHYHLLDLLAAYQRQGNLDYVCCINDHLIDWIISSSSKAKSTAWAQWRGLEAAYRLVHWKSIFYNLQQVKEFSWTARILMLSSIPDHAYYLRYLHAWGANWISREMKGLATAALYWPEFKDSQHWLAYATNRMYHASHEQVYPDGVNKELTSHYHRIQLHDFQDFISLLEKSGNSPSAAFKANLERMWNYLAYSMRPDGHSLLNNDSDRDWNQPKISQAAMTYRRSDWTYIATNGQAGLKPEAELSTVFPWAGQVVMRSGWHAEAQWAFFDVGSLGTNYHVHHDKLHLSVAAYGRDLLVDSGRYSYVRDKFWQYFRSSASHNVILIDGKGQKEDVKEWQKPMTGNYTIQPEFDFVEGTFDRGFVDTRGKITHSRTVVYVRGRYWVVIDRISTDRPRKLEPLWHFHPSCTVAVEGESVVSTDAGMGNLRIVPASDLSWQAKIITGQHDPVQGWWSSTYNHIAPSPTAVYSTEIEVSKNFAWVLFPAKGLVPKINVDSLTAPPGAVRLTITVADQEPDEIVVSIIESEPVELTGHLKLDGKCAILRPDKQPLVAYGCITNADGRVVVEHSMACAKARGKRN